VLDIDEMGSKEIDDLLQKIEYGHLGCTSQGYPYVVPMQYYFENPNLYIFTTEGMKTKYIDSNPEVCLQVEEINDLSHWRSIIVRGRAYRLTDQQEFTHAMQLIKAKNPELSPALNRTWIDAWGRENIIVIYRIYPNEMTGRTTQGVSSQS
jgi:nitroimidazol reductase NimA-like FMN-containing flavoprotein (pyridoxamine 5'-phosphate oxidase superfamily)